MRFRADFPRTAPNTVIAAMSAVAARSPQPTSGSQHGCMTLTQLLEVAAELRVDISSERLQMLLHRAQIQRIHRLSRGRPKVAARMYAAAADLDPNVSTFHLHLGAELSSVGNLTGAAAALTTAIALLQSHPSDDGAGREEEMLRARMGLAIALQGQVADLLIASPPDAVSWGPGRTGKLQADIVQQYEALLLEYPDAEAVWYLMARALRHSNEGSRALAAAVRLFPPPAVRRGGSEMERKDLAWGQKTGGVEIGGVGKGVVAVVDDQGQGGSRASSLSRRLSSYRFAS